jgi:outer membrane protein assembly factor BamB
MAQIDQPTLRKPLRLWPGVVAAVLLCVVRFGVPMVAPDALELSVAGGVVGGLLVVVWWLFFSRAAWLERGGAILLMIVALAATRPILHPSMATGAMGLLYFIYAIPLLSLAFVVWAVATRRLSDRVRRATMVATILLACGGWALIRTNGFNAELASDFAWRCAPTAEERLVAHASDKPIAIPPAVAAAKTPEEHADANAAPVAIPPAPVTAKISREPAAHVPTPAAAASTITSGADWPGFRGPHRDGILPGVRIETDWAATPPVPLWRRPIGPGWSSFAVHGDFLYTQEQRGNDEMVACYQVSTGEPVWKHADAARFWESNAGPGPRATPTLYNGRVYTFGATGIVNALDARDGAVIWSRNAGADGGMKTPEWAFASSPLVVDDMVIVAASGKLVAYDLATGKPRWLGPDGGGSYSSPRLMTTDGITEVLLMSETGAVGVAPSDGAVLWKYALSGFPIVQPGLTSEGDILVSVSEGGGIHRLAVAHGSGGWTVEERWKSPGLKPYFNDFVVHNGHAYGFDGGILACIDLKDGKRTWKGGRYGHGQLILLSDQDVLLVLSEEGELALVSAVPDQFKELARFPAIEGKTWNHPVLAGDVLLVRNGEQMAAFRLSLARR